MGHQRKRVARSICKGTSCTWASHTLPCAVVAEASGFFIGGGLERRDSNSEECIGTRLTATSRVMAGPGAELAVDRWMMLEGIPRGFI